MKETGACEGLPNEPRADSLSVLNDQLPVGLFSKGQLSKGCDDKRINETESNGSDQCIQASGDEMLSHSDPLRQGEMR